MNVAICQFPLNAWLYVNNNIAIISDVVSTAHIFKEICVAKDTKASTAAVIVAPFLTDIVV